MTQHLVQITAPPELVAQACRGDERARAKLYETLAPATFGLIRRMVGRKALHATRILRSYQPGEKVAMRVMRQKRAVNLEVVLPENAAHPRVKALRTS